MAGPIVGYALWIPGEEAPRMLHISEEASKAAKLRWHESYKDAEIVPLEVAKLESAARVPLTPVPNGWKLLKDTTHAEREWTEDARHENGQYFSTCCVCLRQFVGHKRRVVCKACARKGAVEAASQKQKD